jgi:tryptophan-rich sensory protein
VTLRRDPHWAALALSAAATGLTAVIGGYASVSAQAYYGSLTQPAWAPPASVFGPVWTLLYLMMCVAAWLVVRELGVRAARPAMALFGVQLVLNALWTWLFFRWHLGALAFAEVVVLFITIALTARAFWRARRLAGWLMLPYLAWVGFATALTLAVWQLNPGAL